MKKPYLIATLCALLLSSCAYMQSHKNIKEAGIKYEGCRIDEDSLGITNKGNQWYLVVPTKVYSKKYPIFHDSILLTDNNKPTFKSYTVDKPLAPTLLPISAGTAATLQMQNGYYNPEDLALEIQRQMENTPVLTDARVHHKYSVKAQKAEVAEPVVLTHNSTGAPSTARRVLSTLDFAFVDVPGTLVYNVAIPVMAPFIFFHEFLNEED